VQAEYGQVQIDPITGDGYKVVQLTEEEGHLKFTLTLLNEAGGPVAGHPVAYVWPDGEDCLTTQGNGVAEHTHGGGEGYWPPEETGVIHWEVRGGVNAEVPRNFGWKKGTQYRKLQVTMQWISSATPPPADDNWQNLFEKLDTIIGKL